MEEIDDPWRHRQPPDNEIPGSIAFEAVLASSADLVVFMSGMSVFRHGIEFTVEVRVRPGRARGDGAERLGGEIHGHGSSGNRLLLGIEFADGRRCTNVGGRHGMDSPTPDDQPQLWPGGGGGSDRSASASWFLSPLPPPGGFRIICAWPAWDVPETITDVAGEPIHQAAGRARELWPWQPELPDRDPMPPELPPGGWFAEHTRSK
jgi:hypothetical protein